MAAIAGNNINEITASQSIRFIIATQFPLGVLSIARIAVNAAGHDGWMLLIIAGLIVVAAKLIISKLCNRFNGSSILDIDTELFGRFIGTFLNLVWTVYLLFASIVNFTFFMLTIKLWLFRYTPALLIAILLISPTLLLVGKGLKNICRFAMILYIMLVITLLLLIYGFSRLKITLLLPIGESGFFKILEGLPMLSFSFMGFETLLFIFPYIRNKKDVTKYTWVCGTLITFFFTFTSIITICVFGAQYTSQSLYPLTSLAKIVKFPVFERIDLYYYAIWIPGMVLCTNSYVFCTCDSIKRIFRLKKAAWVTPVVCLILVMVSSMIKDIDLSEELGSIGGYSSCIIGIAVPVILLLIALVFRKGGAEKNDNKKARNKENC